MNTRPNSLKQPWSVEDIATLKRLREQRLTCQEIADIMGRSREAVRQQCVVQAASLTPTDEKWLECFMRGLSTRVTADLMHVSERSVARHRSRLRKMGYVFPETVLSKLVRERLAKGEPGTGQKKGGK